MTLRVRRATARDVGAMTDVIFRSKASNGYDAAFMEACRDELRMSAEKLATARYWVAEEAAILGCVGLVQKRSDFGEISDMFVAPEGKGRGVGRSLWEAAIAAARQDGVTRIELDADPAAVPFYARMGCAVIGEAPSGSIPGRVLPVMRLRL